MIPAVVALAIAVAILGILVLGLLRSHALILKALHELGAGLELEKEAAAQPTSTSGPVPVELETGVVPQANRGFQPVADVIGTDLTGAERTLDLSSGRTLLAFLTTGCSVCQTFWETFTEPDLEIPGNGALRVVAKGSAEESPATLRRLAADRIDVTQSSAAWTDLEIPGSPYFVYVENGRITGEGSATTWEQVRNLMSQGLADAEAAQVERVLHLEDRGERDNLNLIDSELLSAGIRPGDPSLYRSPDLPS